MEASACRIQALIARVEEQLSEAGLSGEVDFISEDGAVLVSEAGSTNGSPPGESESSMIRSGGTAPADEWSGGPRLETSNLEPTGGHVSLRVVRGGGENHDQISVHAANSSSSITIAHAPPPGQHPPPSHKPQSPRQRKGKAHPFRRPLPCRSRRRRHSRPNRTFANRHHHRRRSANRHRPTSHPSPLFLICKRDPSSSSRH